MDGMDDAPVITAVDGRIGWLTLNRPDAMNAITLALARALEGGLRRLAAEAAVIVIRGAGGNLSAGGDVGEVARRRAEGPKALAELFDSLEHIMSAAGEAAIAAFTGRKST